VDLESLDLDDELQQVVSADMSLDERHECATQPLNYIADELKACGLQFLQLLHSVRCERPPSNQPLPTHLKVHLPAAMSVQPTHILAVHGQSELLLLPTHGLVRSACHAHAQNWGAIQPYAFLSPKLATLARSGFTLDNGSFAYLPVVSVRVPAINSFSLLHSFVLCPSVPALLGQLLPIDLSGARLDRMALAVAALTPKQQVDSAELVYGLWQNAVARKCLRTLPWRVMNAFLVEIANDDLWLTISMAWSLLRTALQERMSAWRGHWRLARDASG
jgi:hypothetical protein